MELRDLIREVKDKTKIAIVNFERGYYAACRCHLGILYDLLDEEIGSWVEKKCESDESSEKE